MSERTVNVAGTEVRFRSSAAIPRMYRLRFGRDIFREISELQKDFEANKDGDMSDIAIDNLEKFENIAYIMAKHADPSIPDDIDEWLEQFEMFDIYTILPEILQMWTENMATDVAPKKK